MTHRGTVLKAGGDVYVDPRFAVRPETAWTATLPDSRYYGLGSTPEEAAIDILAKARKEKEEK